MASALRLSGSLFKVLGRLPEVRSAFAQRDYWASAEAVTVDSQAVPDVVS